MKGAAVVQSLLEAAQLSIEQDDALSLTFAIRRLAALGHVREGFELGVALQHLTNVPPHIASRALSLLHNEVLVSTQPLAAYALARIYVLGILGAERNVQRACEYYGRAADLGMKAASIFLGACAPEAFDGEKGRETAMRHFEKASAAGFFYASRALVLLRTDIGRTRKFLESLKLWVQVFKAALDDPSSPRLFLLNDLATAEYWKQFAVSEAENGRG